MEYLSVVLKGHDGIVQGMEFSKDSRRVVTRSRDGTAKVWVLEGGDALRTLKGLPGIEDDDLRSRFINETLFARLTPDGARLIALTDEPKATISIKPVMGLGGTAFDSPHGPLNVWDLKTGTLQWAFPGFDKGIACVDLSANGNLLAAGQHDTLYFKRVYRNLLKSGERGSQVKTDDPTSVWVWDLRTGEMVQDLEGHDGKVEMVKFSPDNDRLISSDARSTRLWDVTTGDPLRLFEQAQFVQDCSFLPDGKRVMLQSPGRAGIWSLETGKMLARFSTDGRWADVRQCVISPSGDLAACVSFSSTVDLRSTTTGEVVRQLGGSRSMVTTVAFNPSGELLAAGSEDKTVKVWGALTGKLVRTLEGHKASVTSVVFSPDGRWLGSTSLDFTARLWPVGAL